MQTANRHDAYIQDIITHLETLQRKREGGEVGGDQDQDQDLGKVG